MEDYTKILRPRQIDAEFCLMAEDVDYQKEAELAANEFSSSDWEALEIAEGHVGGETHIAR
jgi:hypothetical protein